MDNTNYDKVNGDVAFRESDHAYFNLKDEKKKYTSVTTMIHSYGQEFDKNFWSGVKAMQALLGEDNWKAEKKHIYESHKIPVKQLSKLYGFTENDYNREQQKVLDDWQRKNIEACEHGTLIHSQLENESYKNPNVVATRFGLGGKMYSCKKNYFALDQENGLYPEFLIYDEEDGLAGQIDLLIKQGNDIYIADYKGLPLDTLIPTKDGWTTIRDIKEGDEIFDKDGNVTKVLHKSDIHYNPCFKITFDNGESITADHEHRWLISFRRPDKSYKEVIMTTEEIAKWLMEKPRTSYNIPKIINAKPLNLPKIELPIDPYVLGCWLGDGSKSCGILTNINPKVWKEIENREYFIGNDLSDESHAEMRTIYNIRDKLNDLGVLNNKFIPDLYMRASYQQRLDLLRGLMDTDGYYHKNRKRFVMGTTQEWQAKDLLKLVSTLGIKATMFKVNKTCNGKMFEGWDVCFSTNNINPFLVRNQDIEFPSIDKNSFRNIVSVEKVDTIATQCLEVDSSTHTFLFGESMIVTHNTNKELKENSGFDYGTKSRVKMKFPLNQLDDCNMSHYTLQLSTYAYMLQKINPKFNIIKLIIEHHAHNGQVKAYEVEYMKDKVKVMIEHFKKQRALEEKRARRKPIIF